MLEDQIQQGEKGAINTLASALNGRDIKDGITYISVFNSKLTEALNRAPKETVTTKKEEVINSSELLEDIRKDMENER